MAKTLAIDLPHCGIWHGNISIIGSGKNASLRIAFGKGKGAEHEYCCAWIDNGPNLRRFLKSALKRCEVSK